MLEIDTFHRLKGVAFCASPFFNHRPSDTAISLLVIHHISLPAGVFGGGYIQDLFMGCLDIDAHPSFAPLKGLEVSAHCLIRRSGEVIQFVPFDKRAWHAGESCFEGQEKCNDFSIGIELEGTGDIAYTDEQYSALVEITEAIMRSYPLVTKTRITGHENIAPQRKTDPGPSFDWNRYLNSL